MNAKEHFGSWEEAVEWLRQQPDQQELVEDAYYDDPLLDAASRYYSSEEWKVIDGLCPSHPRDGTARALDVGAGRGIASYALAKEGYTVDALEPDTSEIVGSNAIRNLSTVSALPINVREDFSEKLPYPDASFDLVFARAVLHHTKSLEEACQEFYRVLKPGGVLIAVREHVISKHEDLPKFLDLHPLHKLYGGENAFLLNEYQDAIVNSGFYLDRTISPLESPINYAPYTLRSLQEELAQRISGHIPAITGVVKFIFSIPPLWVLSQKLLSRLDNRPGRLYSFIARRV